MAIAAAVVLAPAAARAQQPAAAAYVDRPVESIAILIENRPSTDPSLTSVLDTKVGAPLSIAAVRESITHFYSLGRFEEVTVDATTAAGGGVALIYRLEPIHNVSKVDFRGDLGIGDSVLRARMLDRFGATPPLARAAEVAAAFVQLYEDRGYLKASVKPAPPIIQHDPDRATLVFDIEAGPRAHVGAIDVRGTPLDPAPVVLSKLGLSTGQPYDPIDLKAKIDKYVASVRGRGYYLAAVSDRRTVSSDGRQIDLTLDVNAGPQVTVRYEGDPIPKDKIADLVPIEREGSVDPDLIDDSAQRIRDYFHAQGYWKADVKTERQESNAALTIVFRISRGALYHVAAGGLEIIGKHYTQVEFQNDSASSRLTASACRLAIA